ncbi:MAG: TonB-dependent receptor [Bacteroidetes bacterium]|nr:TonB-dependent receptor [Bacteroidota bacterium]
MKALYFAACMALAPWVAAQETPKSETIKTESIQEVMLKKKLVQKKSDRLVYQIASSPMAKGSNGFELLKQTPMVSTTDEKSFKILGKNAVSIYINGKKQIMESEAILDLLKNTPSENISKIEVITVPSSEFPIEGNEAIINIILKKNTTDGWNGNAKLESSQAKSNFTSASVSLNFRKGKWGVQTNINAAKGIRNQDYTLSNGNLSSAQPFQLTSVGEVVNHISLAGGFANINYDINDRQKLDFSYQLRGKKDNPAYTEFYNELTDLSSGTIVGRTQTKNDMVARNYNHAFNTGYEWKTDEQGSALSANLSYLNFDKLEENTNATYLLNPNLQTMGIQKKFFQSTPLNINNFGGKIDYVQQLKNGQSISIGSNYNYTKTDSDALVNNIMPPTGKDDNQSNHFVYNEKIWGLYTTWDKKWTDAFATKVGLRLEKNDAQGNVLDKNITINRNETNWLPYLSLNYATNADHQFSYTFSSRVKRPSFWALNPVKIYLTANNYIQNNPFAESELFYNSELQYVLKSAYFLTLSYNYTDKASEQIPLAGTKNDGSGEKVLAYIRTNYGSKQEFSLSLGMQKQFFNGIWTVNNSMVMGYNQYRGFVHSDPNDNQNLVTFQGKNMNASSVYLQMQLNNMLRLSANKDWYLGLNYFYLTPIQLEVGKLNNIQSLNVSLKKTYQNWTFNLEAQDIFNTNQNNIQSQDDFGNFNKVIQDQYNRKVVLGVTYSFGNQKIKKVKKSDAANDEIRSRTQN